MNNDIPTVVGICRDDTKIEVCHGEIPDVCQTRNSTYGYIYIVMQHLLSKKSLLGIAKCN